MPSNSQNNHVYGTVRQGECKTWHVTKLTAEARKHFTKVSVAVSKLGKMSLVFVQPEANLNSAYYCDHVLKMVRCLATISLSSRTVCRHTDQNTLRLSCRQMFLTSLSHQTGQLTHLIWIWWIIQFVVLFSSWYIIRRSRTLTIWNKFWTVAGTWSATN